jgi:hypothetical protein
VRDALLEAKLVVDVLLATLAPLERRRSLPDREQRQEIAFLRRELEIRSGEIRRQWHGRRRVRGVRSEGGR